MKKIIKVLLMIPFLFVNQQFASKESYEVSENQEPIELRMRKLSLEHIQNQIFSLESEVSFNLFIRDLKNK